jgi:hypothetical protein
MKALCPGNAMATAPTLTTALPSTQEWKDVLEEILPPQGRWSEDEYLVLTDHRNRLVEFTDGFLDDTVVADESPAHWLVDGTINSCRS